MRGTTAMLWIGLAAMAASTPATSAEPDRLRSELGKILDGLECPFGPCDGEALEAVGGGLTGLASLGVICQNFTTGQRIIAPSLTGSWDCQAMGLAVRLGDVVITGGLGVVSIFPPSTEPVGGFVTDLTPSLVLCQNLTTGQRVVGPTLTNSWDCEAMGLSVSAGHTVLTGAAGLALPFPEQ